MNKKQIKQAPLEKCSLICFLAALVFISAGGHCPHGNELSRLCCFCAVQKAEQGLFWTAGEHRVYTQLPKENTDKAAIFLYSTDSEISKAGI